MKRFIPIFALSLLAVTVCAQEKTDSLYITLAKGQVAKYAVSDIYSMGFTKDIVPQFPLADESTALEKLNPSTSVKKLLEKAGTACTDTLGRVEITQEEYDEIKQFTDELVKGKTTQFEKYRACYEWITSNVKYAHDGYVDNNPYPVFKTHSAVCQGYANLLFVMMRGQGIPAMVVNGYLEARIVDGQLTGGGHAWNYVCCDDTWYVSDPTNSLEYPMKTLANYKYKLAPTSMDVVVFKENDCWFNFNEARLNICKVATENSVYVTPYSVQGFMVSSFNPFEELPSCVREIYLSANIESLGEEILGLQRYAPNVEYITVEEGNPNFVSNAGVLYYSENYVPKEYWVPVDRNVPAYIPSAIKRIELKAFNIPSTGVVYDKNAIYKVAEVEEIVFPKETAKLENFAVEQCPNLKVAYLPKGAQVAESAFLQVHKDFRIEYYE